MFSGFLGESIVARGLARSLFQVCLWDIRNYCSDKHRTADDYPFGGGAGMLLKAEPIAKAIQAVCAQQTTTLAKTIYLSPGGVPLHHALAQELAQESRLLLLCGHYEGVDQRVIDRYVDLEISLGDYILSSGELGAMVLIEAIVRLIPGVLGSWESTESESFARQLLEYPQYTRPASYEGDHVPEVLLSGNHGAIATWRLQEALRRTLERRPNLLLKAKLSPEERKLLAKLLSGTS